MGNRRIGLVLLLGLAALVASSPVLAFDVQVGTGNFAGIWDIDFSGNWRTGPGLVTGLAAGHHVIQTGARSAQVTFTILPTGEVELPPAFQGSATGGLDTTGNGKLDLITVAVTVDPGAYGGGWGIEGVRDHNAPNAGVETVHLVPSERLNNGIIGNSYLASVGHGGSLFIIDVRTDGSLTLRSGSFATADVADPVAASSGILRFRNHTISITDTEGSGYAVALNDVATLPPTSNVVIVPGARYLITIRDLNVFTVAYPCAIDPPFVTTNDGLRDYRYDISCGISDLDQDGVPDTTDNCLLEPNPDQIDLDQDGDGDACDPDDDGDGVGDDIDNCPMDPNPDQADGDGDQQGDVCDDSADDDGDGVVNGDDLCPLSPALTVDADGCTGAQRIARLCRIEDYVQHGQFVSCVAHQANRAADDGLIAPNEKSKFVREAAKAR